MWERCLVIVAQVVVFLALAVLVALGHDSYITDGMIAIGASLTGVNLWETTTRMRKPKD